MHIETTHQKNYSLAKIEKPGALTVSILITVDCFTGHSAKNSILQHVYSDLLMSGAGTYTRSEFLHALNALGATIEVSSTGYKTTITVATPKPKLAPTLSLLEAVLEKPRFAPKELKRALSTIENTLELAKEDARGIAQSNLKNNFYKKTDRHYTFTPDELKSVLKEITLADIKKLHTTFTTGIFTISIGGSKESIATVMMTIGKIKTSSVPREEVYCNTQALPKPLVTLHEVKSKQNIEISIGAALPLTLEHKDAPAFMFGLSVLGKWGGFAGRLMSTVREKEGLTYGIYARTENLGLNNTGYWRIMSFFAPKDVIKGITSSKREVALIAEKGITQSEFERFKTILKTGEVLVFDSLSGTTGLVHNNLVSGLLWDDYLVYKERFHNCTKAEINAALKKYLHPDNLVISAAGPVASVKKELLALNKTK